jgi:predicted nucleic acid-binding protein
MRKKVVLDASAIAKWYRREEESEEMKALRTKILTGEVEAHVPDFAFVELANVLRKGSNAAVVAEGVRAAMALGMTVHRFEELFEKVAEIAFARDLTIYDAIYAALAELEDAALVTYDNKLLAKTGEAQRASDFLRALEK